MSVLTKQFQDALSRIEPGADAVYAADAHSEVRDALSDHADLADWGLHTVLIGSYRRNVSIRRVKDVDVFCELPGIPRSIDPQALLELFSAVLQTTYGDRISKNDRSVKVDFPDYGMHVDVVPARCAGEMWEIPDRDGGWETTHPVRFSELSTERNQTHNDQYVPIVKLLRQTRRALIGEAKPGGFFVEVAAYNAFESIPDGSAEGAPKSTAEYYTVALEKMAPILRDHSAARAYLKNPAVPDQELHIRATQAELDAIAEQWEIAAADAREAFDSADEQLAARTFKRLFGQNSDGEDVFEVPVVVAAGHRRLPSGESPTFG